MNSIELVSPAGDLEKLKTAFAYGADAVYLSDRHYGMRARAANFTEDEIAKGVEFARGMKKKVYVAVNIFIRDSHLDGIKRYLSFLNDIKVDAVVIADVGLLKMIRDCGCGFDIHVSTLANVTNSEAARFWEKSGAKRVILARELSLDEIRGIRKEVKCELEAFVHGAMCISYSGRCLVSNYLSGRGANLGDCVQSCRWNYSLQEEKRPGEYFPIEEDDSGSYVMSSKDLSMIGGLEDLIAAGVDAFKIEGRMKSLYYVGNVTRIYRSAFDSIADGHATDVEREYWSRELASVPNRGFTTGFYYGAPGTSSQSYDVNGDTGGYQFIGIVREADGNKAVVALKNPVSVNDSVEIISPVAEKHRGALVEEITDKDGFPVKTAGSEQTVSIRFSEKIGEYALIRKRIQDQK